MSSRETREDGTTPGIQELEARLITLLERQLERDRGDLRIVVAAQSRSMQDLTTRVDELQSKVSIFSEIQKDWLEQKAARAAWGKIRDFVQWIVVVLAAMVGAVAAYFGMHAGKP